MANVLRGLGRMGEIDLCAFTNQPHDGVLPIPPDVPVRRATVIARPRPGSSLIGRAAWFAAGRLPFEIAQRDYREVRDQIRQWLDGPYDLAWLSRLESHAVCGPLAHAPTIVDVDDLEDVKLLGVWAAGAHRRRRGLRASMQAFRRPFARWQSMKNVNLWRMLQARTMASADGVVVCSDVDRGRLGGANVFVIPNGYDVQQRPVGRVATGFPPTVMFPGYLFYPPNADAARFLVEEIAPLIRRRVPDAQVRLVGHADERVLRLQAPPHVVATGFVDDMREELARADVVAVPVRFGSGTRIKILEAFAHRIPVVSTSAGAEGLEVRDGRELLIADTPEVFAEACARLLTDQAARAALVEAAHALFHAKYRWETIHEMIEALGTRITDRAKRGMEQ